MWEAFCVFNLSLPTHIHMLLRLHALCSCMYAHVLYCCDTCVCMYVHTYERACLRAKNASYMWPLIAKIMLINTYYIIYYVGLD